MKIKASDNNYICSAYEMQQFHISIFNARTQALRIRHVRQAEPSQSVSRIKHFGSR